MTHRSYRPRDGGFVALVALLVLGTFAVVVWVGVQPYLRHSADLRARALEARFAAELADELRRLEPSLEGATSRAALGAVARGNLLRKGLLDLRRLEKQRHELRQLTGDSLTSVQREERRRLLRQLDHDIRRARLWVRLLRSRIGSA